MKSGQVTIKDLAQQLNISPSTVSRALKNHPDISQKTKNEVNRLAKELDYQPNLIAQSLRQSKTFTLGVIVPNIVHHFFSTVISGMEDLAHEHGYNLIITQSNESYLREVENVRALLSSRVDGILVSLSRETNDFEHLEMIKKRKIPLVFFDRVVEGFQSHQILVEDFKGAYAAVDYLIQKGCRKILHLAGPQSLGISYQRTRGYREAHRAHNLEVIESRIIPADNRERAEEVILQLCKEGLDFDGVFTVNDDTAFGVILALRKAQVSIPEEVKVIGFGDDPMAAMTLPALSSVAQPGFEMGRAAVELFLQESEALAKEVFFAPQKRVFETQLKIKGSTT